MNWQQIAADVFEGYRLPVADSDLAALADDLATTAQQFIADKANKRRDAIEAERNAYWRKIDEARGK